MLFNQFVESRENAKHTADDIHILFCHEGILGPGEVFQSNHKFVVAGHALGQTFGDALFFYLTTLSKILDPPLTAKELSSGAKEHGTVKYDNYANMLVTLISEKKDIT